MSAGRLIPFNSWNSDRSDKGNDPDFRGKPYSWGICRPGIRRGVREGETLFFVARDRKDRTGFYLKGYFRVERKLSLPQALRDPALRDRQNVLLRELHATGDLGAALEEYWRANGRPPVEATRYRHLRGKVSPPPLSALSHWMLVDRNRVYAHSVRDDHHADDWRCGRLFICPKSEREACLESGLDPTCNARRKAGLDERNYYIVGDEVDSAVLPVGLPWEEVVRQLGGEFDTLLRSCFTDRARMAKPYRRIVGQMNTRRLEEHQVDMLRSVFH